jgi:hypothetical protein
LSKVGLGGTEKKINKLRPGVRNPLNLFENYSLEEFFFFIFREAQLKFEVTGHIF